MRLMSFDLDVGKLDAARAIVGMPLFLATATIVHQSGA